MLELIRNVLLAIGEDPTREGLKDTPKRVSKMIKEILGGYDTDINSLFTTFDGEGQDQVICLKDIEFWSLCEHHMLPFHCVANIAYLPDKKVIGVSKIARLVLAYGKRLQIQERITEQVANTLMEKLKPKGVAVILEGQHLCMQMRGVKNSTSKMTTSIMLGEFRDNSALRAEVLNMLGRK